jgi:serine kinase of HPr protein (carbohydrate metabolism regulator)
MIAKDLEKKLEARESELKSKLEESKKLNQSQLKKLADEYETQIQKLKNSVTSLQNELNIECNQMSAQEEMMHGLLHSICTEFSGYVEI